MAYAAWTQCPNCEDYWCNYHQQHAAECDCPEVDVWLTVLEQWPYTYMPEPEEMERLYAHVRDEPVPEEVGSSQQEDEKEGPA